MLHFIIAALGIWAAPFIASFPFFSRDGKLVANFFVFKAVMAIVLSVTTYFLAKWYFGKHIPESLFIAALTLIGIAAVSIIIDQFTVIKFTKMSYAEYYIQVVSLYSLIIIVGLVAAKSRMLK